MRVLVTGAKGFTGTYLVAELLARGCEVVTLASDISDAGSVDAEIASARPDRVIHLAAIAFVGTAAADSLYQVNQLGTFHLLDAVARQAPQAHVLIASSANIYGNSTAGYLDENTPPNPVNHYAVSKWAMELGARCWADKVRMTIVRPFNYTGVGQDEQYLIPKIVSHFRRREAVITLGNINVSRDFGDVRSVVAAYCELSLEPPEVPVVNVCTGRVFSIREVIAVASELTGHTIEIASDPALMRSNEVEILAGNATLLKRLLPTWEPRRLEDTLDWMLRVR